MYMTEKEKKAIRVAAAKRDTTMAEYCRDAVIVQLKQDRELPNDE
jgi:hypothetical protein